MRPTAGIAAFARVLHETLDPRLSRRLDDDLQSLRDAGTGLPIPLQLIYSERDPMVPPHVGDPCTG